PAPLDVDGRLPLSARISWQSAASSGSMACDLASGWRPGRRQRCAGSSRHNLSIGSSMPDCRQGAFMRYEIRELGLGEILDQAVKLTKNHIGVLLGVTGVLLIPYNLISGFVQVFSATKLPLNPTPEQVVAASFGNLAIVLPVTLIGAYVIVPITNAAVVY